MINLIAAVIINGWTFDLAAVPNWGLVIYLGSPDGQQYIGPVGENCKIRFEEEDQAGDWAEQWINSSSKDFTCVQPLNK